MRKPLLLIILSLIILASGCTKNSHVPLESCGTEYEFFTVAPIGNSEFENLEPLGAVSPPSHIFPIDHMYFHLNRVSDEAEMGTFPVDVKAPGDMWITRVWEIDYNGEYVNDYSVFFSPCSEVEGFFFHLTSVSERIKSEFDKADGWCHEYDTGGVTHSTCEKGLSVRVSAGEVIGTAGGPERNSFDIGMIDTRREPPRYANIARWSGYQRTMTVVCPLDYFSSDAKAGLEEKLGEHLHNGTLAKRTIEPICGQVAQDEPGTAQGAWFAKGVAQATPEDPHLSLVHEAYDPSNPVLSIGSSVPGVEPGRYYFDPSETGLVNMDFDKVTPGNVYCYDLRGKWRQDETKLALILSMPTETTLDMEKLPGDSCGTGPWSFTNPAEFER